MLSKSLVQEMIDAALATGGDFAEVFAEEKLTTSVQLVSSRVESAVSGRDFGVAVRIFRGLNSVYAYTNRHGREDLLALAASAARAIPGKAGQDRNLNLMGTPSGTHHEVRLIPSEVPLERKVAVMRETDRIARAYSPEISQVSVAYLDEDQGVLIANSEGTFAEDRRVRGRLALEAIASAGSDMQTGFYGPGMHQGFEFFEGLDLNHYASEAARTAVTMLHAQECPSGRFPVVLENEFGGVIFHEACGHGMEATSVAKKASVFADKLGQQIAPSIVTYIDDGTLANEWGSQRLDDEGEPLRRTVLVQDGVLVGYLIDKLNGRRMSMDATGSGRRQSYKFAPTSRMTNTFIAPGDHTREEIIAATEFGIYARYLGGGSVNPATGEYNFAVREGYMIRNGKLAEPLRGATLIGTGLETMQKVDMVGNNLAHGQGMCGSLSGSIPVNVGQPTLRVSEITVGGRKGK